MSESKPVVTKLSQWSEIYMHNSMRNFLLFAKERGLSMSQIGALFRLFHHSNTAVSDIGEELGVTNAAASQMLERLVQQGLILRTEDPTDRRVKQLVITSKGREVVQESIRLRQVWMEELAGLLSPEEKEQVAQALEILISKARMFEPGPLPRP